MEKEILTSEQIEFINKPTIAGLLGPFYAIANGMYKQFWFCFIPFYNIYLIFKLIVKGRRMAWRKSDKTYDAFYIQQKKLAKIAKILFGIMAGIFVIQLILLSSLIFTGGGSTFGKDVAINFSQRIFTNQPVSDITSPNFSLNQTYIDFQKDSRGIYEGISFNSFSKSNETSTLQGKVKFENTSMPVCVNLLKFGESWKITGFSQSCPSSSNPSASN